MKYKRKTSDEQIDELYNAFINGQLDSDSNNINYSEEETIIGTWIDGRKVYQKVFIVDSLNVTASSTATYVDTLVGSIPGLSMMIELTGIYDEGSAGRRLCDTVPIPQTITNNMLRAINLILIGTNIYIRQNVYYTGLTASFKTGTNIRIIARYVKTT